MNMMKMNSKYLLILILLSIHHIKSIIVIPFKVNTIPNTRSIKDYNATNFINDYFIRDFYGNIKTGIPNKSILTLLDTRSHYFQFEENYLNRRSLKEIDNTDKTISEAVYDSKSSLSFKNITKIYYTHFENKVASLCSETLLLYTDLTLKKEDPFQEVKFFIDEGLENGLHIQLGLNKPTVKEYQGPPHLFQSLIDIGVIKDQSWTIKFLSKDNGIFVLGAEPHTYQDPDKDKRYQRQYYFQTDSLSSIEYFDPLSVSAKKIFVKNSNGEEIIINEEKGCYFNYNYGFIIGSKEYQEYIKKNFFDNLIDEKICSYDLVNYKDKGDIEEKYYVFSCDKEKIQKYYVNFPDLNFYVYDYNYNFQLKKEDLFTEVNDKSYFMVLFQDYLHPELTYWHLGYPFLKNFEFVFNYETTQIGFYIPYQEEKKDDKEEEDEKKDENDKKDEKNENENGNNVKKYVFFIGGGIVIAIILIVVTFFIAKNIYQKRKGRANELEDDYNYEMQKEQKNKDDQEKFIN